MQEGAIMTGFVILSEVLTQKDDDLSMIGCYERNTRSIAASDKNGMNAICESLRIMRNTGEMDSNEHVR